MNFKTTIIATVALIAAGTATVSSAQARHGNFSVHIGTPNAGIHYTHNNRGYRGPSRHRQALTPREIRRVLRYQGFRHIRNLDRRGRVYVARAVSYNGRLYKIRLNAYNGRIIGQRVIASAGHRGHRWR